MPDPISSTSPTNSPDACYEPDQPPAVSVATPAATSADRKVVQMVPQAVKKAQAVMETSRRRVRFWHWAALLVLVSGMAIEYYAQALGAFIVSECPDLGPHAPGHCVWPYRLAYVGIAVMAVGAASCVWLFVLLLSQKLRKPKRDAEGSAEPRRDA